MAMVACTICAIAGSSQLAQAADYPTATDVIVDTAAVLTAEQLSQFTHTLNSMNARNKAPLSVVLVKTTEGVNIEDYAHGLFLQRHLNETPGNTAILLVVATDDHSLRIQVGDGINNQLNDAVRSMIINRDMVPSFRKSDFAQGIGDGIAAIGDALETDATTLHAAAKDYAARTENMDSYAIIGFGSIFTVIVIFIMIGRIRARRRATALALGIGTGLGLSAAARRRGGGNGLSGPHDSNSVWISSGSDSGGSSSGGGGDSGSSGSW